MRKYIENLLPRIQKFSETLDRKELFIDQPWVLLDDDLNKVQYIFRRDSSIIMSYNGNVGIGKWEYIAGANSLLIDLDGKKHLLNQAFVEKGLLILKKDGYKEAPWILANEKIIPDLDVKKYLNSVLRTKFYIAVQEMDNGDIFEYEDPHTTGLMVGREVVINGSNGMDGLFNADGGNIIYTVRNGKVINIFRKGSAKMKTGERFEFADPNGMGLEIGTDVMVDGRNDITGLFRSDDNLLLYELINGKICNTFNVVFWNTEQGKLEICQPLSGIKGGKVLMNEAWAPDGEYANANSGERITVRSGLITAYKKKLSSDVWVLLAAFLLLVVVGLFAYNWHHRDSNSSAVNTAPIADSSTTSESPEKTSINATTDSVAHSSDDVPVADNNTVVATLSNYYAAVNAGDIALVKSFFAEKVDRYYKFENITQTEVAQEMEHYATSVVANVHATFNTDTIEIRRSGENYFVKVFEYSKSVLRATNVPYSYNVIATFRLNKNLKIYYVNGDVVYRDIDVNTLLNLTYTDKDDLITPLDESFFNNAFTFLNSSYSTTVKIAIENKLLTLGLANVVVYVINDGQRYTLKEYCDKMIGGNINFTTIHYIVKTNDKVAQINVY